MKSEEVREKFLTFFKEYKHKIIPSSSLLADDPQVLLTTAGMQQFKPYFSGLLDPVKDFNTKRVCSIQKCFRTTDLDKVGDTSHLTFFEMLGNFSFGDYFKLKAIKLAWEFIIKELKIPVSRIFVSVFKGQKLESDLESLRIWKEEIGLPADKIKFGGREDNFWGPTGAEGPCGPTTEIYIDGLEVWNIVFNQYYQQKDGQLSKLKTFGVDTGMGLERLTAILNKTTNVFKTDLFSPLASVVQKYGKNLDETKQRIFIDHLRGISFLIGDGLIPSNKEAGYILRRLIRKLTVYQYKYELDYQIFNEGVKAVVEKYQSIYKELELPKILKVLNAEISQFQQTLRRGIKEISKLKFIDTKAVFNLYQSFGLSPELIKYLAPDKLKNFSEIEFQELLKKHQEVSRAGVEAKFGGHGFIPHPRIKKLHTATHLLHQALRDVLGNQVQQQGSDITPERLRFDFNFPRKLTEAELKKIEEIVNQKIKQNLKVYYREMPLQEALKIGALAFFKQKYPDIVRVYFIDDYSKEICKGPHVKNTSELGKFKILKEKGIGKGIRRIKATLN